MIYAKNPKLEVPEPAEPPTEPEIPESPLADPYAPDTGEDESNPEEKSGPIEDADEVFDSIHSPWNS